MERVLLQQLLCQQIYLEKEAFKKEILNASKEDIYAAAYKIDCMLTIYEQLAELSQKMDVATLCSVVTLPDILAHSYSVWLEREDSGWLELQTCLTEEINKRTAIQQEQERMGAE
ncbi:MAG: hypothetical protein UDG86_05965 [Lachnospiraceae bacterium]|jgi:hypothetical protein|nr:hypothetical protein [Lachnospiraceae bacterium]